MVIVVALFVAGHLPTAILARTENCRPQSPKRRERNNERRTAVRIKEESIKTKKGLDRRKGLGQYSITMLITYLGNEERERVEAQVPLPAFFKP